MSSRVSGILAIGLIASILITTGATGSNPGGVSKPSTLETNGLKADQVAALWWFMFWLAAFVFIVVMALLLFAIFRPQRAQAPSTENQRRDIGFVVVGGAVIPALILVFLFLVTLHTMVVQASPPRQTRLTVAVIGHRWWWEFRYLGRSVTTGNEVHVPVGQPVRLELTSADVIHSFWVPQIQQKTDMLPGHINTTWIEATQAGVYRGECAEFCGENHANMDFIFVADPPGRFTAWLARQRQPGPVPSTPLIEQGQQAFLGSACVYCHTIAGTNATGAVGPDLTHLASRRTIGAGLLPNTPGNLAGWIANSQAIKPGNYMPPMNLDPRAMQALLAYLNTLK